MKRLAIIGGLVVTVLAVAVYRAKLSAEETQVRIDELRIAAQAEQAAIATLKADEAVLTRPERIGAIAQQQLGLEPANPDQYVAPEALKQRLGEEKLRLAPPASGATPQPQ
ncbi:MAG: hypothetical protein RIR33_3096 [Pseudomonadota bacterium]|jgi:cell division protein FtsL